LVRCISSALDRSGGSFLGPRPNHSFKADGYAAA
jgi:hypothetical protein